MRQFLRDIINLLWARSAYKFLMRDWERVPDIEHTAQVLNAMRFTRSLQPVELSGPRAPNLCILSPHIDDDVLGAGGTLAKHAKKPGRRCDVIYLTTGKPNEPDTQQAERKREAADAHVDTGATLHFMDMTIGDIPVDQKAGDLLAQLLTHTAPGAIMLPFLLDDHDDHRRVSELLLFLADTNSLPKTVLNAEVWAYQVYTAVLGNVIVDITDTAEAKRSMITAHQSQMRQRDWSHFALGLNAWNCRFLAGRQGPVYGELFFVAPMEAYLELARGYFASTTSPYKTSRY